MNLNEPQEALTAPKQYLSDSLLFQVELPSLLPVMEFLPLRATCKGYARNHAFQELLQVTNPWKALKAAREGCVSIEQLQAENFRVEDKDRKRIKVYSRTGFCCPADRRLFNRCGPTMPGEQHKYFVTYKAESFESSQRERNYRIRRDYPDRRYHDVQTFFWGLGNIELCCFGSCFGQSFIHKVVDMDLCVPSVYDEEEIVI